MVRVMELGGFRGRADVQIAPGPEGLVDSAQSFFWELQMLNHVPQKNRPPLVNEVQQVKVKENGPDAMFMSELDGQLAVVDSQRAVSQQMGD